MNGIGCSLAREWEQGRQTSMRLVAVGLALIPVAILGLAEGGWLGDFMADEWLTLLLSFLPLVGSLLFAAEWRTRESSLTRIHDLLPTPEGPGRWIRSELLQGRLIWSAAYIPCAIYGVYAAVAGAVWNETQLFSESLLPVVLFEAPLSIWCDIPILTAGAFLTRRPLPGLLLVLLILGPLHVHGALLLAHAATGLAIPPGSASYLSLQGAAAAAKVLLLILSVRLLPLLVRQRD